MKKNYVFKTSDKTYRIIGFYQEHNAPASAFQGYWQNKYEIYIYDKHEKNTFYKFIHPSQYEIKTRKMLTMNNIYAHILFKKDLI